MKKKFDKKDKKILDLENRLKFVEPMASRLTEVVALLRELLGVNDMHERLQALENAIDSHIDAHWFR